MSKRPIIGVMVSDGYLRRLNSDPLSDAHLHFQAASKRNLPCFFFSLGTPIGRGVRPLRGWTVVDGTWVEQSMPWPDVIYQRSSVQPRFRWKWRRLRSRAMQINSVIRLNKWLCHSVLEQRAHGRIHLPETLRLRQLSQLVDMVHKHQVVMVKPDGGSRGFGIARVSLDPAGTYSIQPFDQDSPTTGLSSLQLQSQLISIVGSRPCIIQQYIPLLRVDGRVADIRVMLNKNGKGIWVPVVSRLRIGPPERIVSNYHQGGDLLYLRDGLARAGLPEVEREQLTRRTERAAIRVAEWLEQGLGSLGEVGIDLGLDEQFRLWFIEANGRPDKVMPPHEYPGYPPDKYQFVMDYAYYLWRRRKSKFNR